MKIEYRYNSINGIVYRRKEDRRSDGAYFYCRKSGSANVAVTRRFPVTCCPRVRVPRVFVAVGHEPVNKRPVPELDPLDPLGSPYFLPYPRSPLLSTGQKVLLISLPQRDPCISSLQSRLLHLFRTFRFDRSIAHAKKWNRM